MTIGVTSSASAAAAVWYNCPHAHSRDLPDVFLLWLTRRACLAHWVAKVALVSNGVAERGEPGAQLSDSEGRRSHVDATSL